MSKQQQLSEHEWMIVTYLGRCLVALSYRLEKTEYNLAGLIKKYNRDAPESITDSQALNLMHRSGCFTMRPCFQDQVVIGFKPFDEAFPTVIPRQQILSAIK